MKVCIVQSVLKGYRLPLFELLHRELEGRGIELKVLFSKANPIEQQREDNVSVCPSYAVEVPVRWFLGNRFVLQNMRYRRRTWQFNGQRGHTAGFG